MTQPRTPTDVDAVAESHLDAWAAHDPLTATYLGIPGHDAELPALTPDYFAQGSALRQRTLAALRAAVPVDATDRISIVLFLVDFNVLDAMAGRWLIAS